MNNIASKLITNVFSGKPLTVGDTIEFHRAEYEKGNIFESDMVEMKFNEFIDKLGMYVHYSLSQPFNRDSWGVIINIDEIINPGIFVKV